VIVVCSVHLELKNVHLYRQAIAMHEKQAAALDNTRRPLVFLLKYGLPLLVLISSQWWSPYLGGNTLMIALVWSVGLAVMGLACVVNARRCGRVHCHFTGPYMLAFAIAFLIYGSGIYQPAWLSLTQLANLSLWGTGLLWLVTELFFGKYFAANKHEG